jgi:Tol biopolymer transport system component
MRRIGALITVSGMTLFGLALGGAPAAQATTPGANGRIAFSGDPGSGREIYSIRSDGTGLRRLTTMDGQAFSPDWSPDGTRIAFWLEYGSIYLMSPTGGNLHRVPPRRGGSPAFTPDGRHIVYECPDCAGGDGIFLMRADGSDAPGRRLSTNPFAGEGDTNPQVSPDGQTVTFVRRKVDKKLQALFAVDIDGSNTRRLTSYSLEVGISHDWAPDGRHIVITPHGDYPDGQSPNVATIRPNGSALRMLTSYTGGTVGAFTGSYSPDGRWVLFRVENLSRGIYRLYRMHPDGSGRTLIARLPFAPRAADWGPRPGA